MTVKGHRTGVASAVPGSASLAGIAWRAGVITMVTALSYWNSLSGPFIFDDQPSIVSNRQIRELWNLRSVLFPQRELPVAGRPVVNVTLAINYAWGGLDVRGYHVWNIAIHLCCALLAFGIVRRTLESRRLGRNIGRRSVGIAFGAALIWALHPLNTEAVDYVTQRTESMMALCYLLTIYASIRSVASRRAASWQAAAVLSCALGMGCKESMVTAPLMVVMYDRVFVFDSLAHALRSRWRFYGGLAATWLVLAALISSGPRAYSAGFSTDVSPWTYLLNQTVMVTRYLRLALWPRSLVLAYGWPVPLTPGAVMPYALLIAALLLLTVAALRWRPPLGFLGAWFFLTLAPTSSFVPIATEVGAERRMYLPLLALVVLAVTGETLSWDFITHRSSSRTTLLPVPVASFFQAFVLVAVSTALAMGTIARNREYASSLSMARTVLARWPSSFAHHMVGTELAAAGHHEEAMAQLREALPGFPMARYNLGWELFRVGKLDEAIEQFEVFLRGQPMGPEVISARETMGRALGMQSRWPEAIEEFRLVLAATPSSADVHGRLADALFAQHLFEEATVHYQEYLRSHPDDVGALSNRGIALVAGGRLDEAIEVFRHAVAIDPGNANAHRNLATALFDERDIDGATSQAEQALRLNPDDSATHELLGRAFASQGKLDDAAAEFERALQIDPASAEAREELQRVRRVRGLSRLVTPGRYDHLPGPTSSAA